MRNVLAITMALMLAAVILSPAVGYTIQSGANQSYSIGSTRLNYTFHTGAPASEVTPEMIPPSMAPTSAVTVTQVPYSIKLGASAPYSVKLLGTAPTGGVQIPPTEVIGAQTPAAPAVPPVTTPEENITPAEIAAPEENITPAEIMAPEENITPAEIVTPPAPEAAPGTLSIMGLVYDDVDGSGVREANETGLVGWVINLEQPEGTIIANTTTNESGNYAFNDLSLGEYFVFEILPEGWSAVSPANGHTAVNLTDMNAENVDFANRMTMQGNVTANITMPEGNVTAQ